MSFLDVSQDTSSLFSSISFITFDFCFLFFVDEVSSTLSKLHLVLHTNLCLLLRAYIVSFGTQYSQVSISSQQLTHKCCRCFPSSYYANAYYSVSFLLSCYETCWFSKLFRWWEKDRSRCLSYTACVLLSFHVTTYIHTYIQQQCIVIIIITKHNTPGPAGHTVN